MITNKVKVSEQTIQTVVSIRDMTPGQFGETTGKVKWNVYKNGEGVLFLDDFDFFVQDGSRMESSELMVRILPKGTVIHLESTVTV